MPFCPGSYTSAAQRICHCSVASLLLSLIMLPCEASERRLLPARLQELQGLVRAADQAKIVAQQELHEAQLEMRKQRGMMPQLARVLDVDEAEGVHAIISELENQGIGEEAPVA